MLDFECSDLIRHKVPESIQNKNAQKLGSKVVAPFFMMVFILIPCSTI